MRIREIRIEKLFGVFDHIIPLNMKDRITIIHGPNGYGKTNILRLIDAIFYLKYSVLYSIPFKSIEIDFDNDETLKIERLVNQENTITIRFSHIINGKNDESYFEVESDYYDEIIKNKDFDTIILPEAERAAQNTRWLSRKDYLYWKDGRDNTILNTIQVIEAYGNETILLNYKLVPEWLKQLISHEIRKIETDRLYRDPMQADTQKQMLTKTVLNTIFIFQNELIDLINKTRQEYAIYSQKLDSSFLLRLSGNGNEIAATDTQHRLRQIDELQSRLVEAGIIDKPETSDLNPDLLKNQTLNSPNISLFLNDTFNKLMLYKPLLKKIELLKSLVNSRYCYKKLKISKDMGFEFIAGSGELIAPPNLSSGERHLLVLFFDLIFGTQPGTLVLIDEPELSLHLIWQNDFLKALSQIIEINKVDIIIATHAPDLIQDRWDLTVELKGIEDDIEN